MVYPANTSRLQVVYLAVEQQQGYQMAYPANKSHVATGDVAWGETGMLRTEMSGLGEVLLGLLAWLKQGAPELLCSWHRENHLQL